MMKFASNYHKIAYDVLTQNQQVAHSMKLFSVSDEDYKQRMNVYMNALARTSTIEDRALANGAKRRVMQFASAGPGMGAANLRGTTIYPATILSFVSSIAPIFCVEREMDTPQADLQFVDFYSLLKGDLVLPNLGNDRNFGNNVYTKNMSSQLDGTTSQFELTIGSAIVPNSIEITYVDTNKNINTIYDNGSGILLGAPGLLTAGTVNYKTGTVNITFTTAPKAKETLNIRVAKDVPAEENVDKMMGEVRYFHVTTEAIMVPIVRNIVTDAALNKQGVIDPNTLYTNLIQSTYTKLINEKVVESIIRAYNGDTYNADLSSFNLAAGFYDTFIRSFQSVLVDAESVLGQQTYKGSKCTGYLAGTQVANMFQYMNAGEGWVPNDQLMYFKDLIGWYKGVPVVRWEDDNLIAKDELFLTHKTQDGQLAPAVRGMFLTPTDLPEVGNFLNSSQITNGCFSLEGVRSTTSKLVVKIKFKLPESQFLVK